MEKVKNRMKMIQPRARKQGKPWLSGLTDGFEDGLCLLCALNGKKAAAGLRRHVT